MSIFKSMNFTRWIIVGCIVSIGILGYLLYRDQVHLDEVKAQVDRRAPELVTEIQEKSKRLTRLVEDLDKDRFARLGDEEQYVMVIAEQPDVGIGTVSADPGEKSLGGGLVDLTVRIEPFDDASIYTPTAIANYLYRLEEESRKVKVTAFEFKPVQRLDPEQYGVDRNWSFDATITIRQANEDS